MTLSTDVERPAPFWVRAAAAVIGRAPVGRYRLTHGLARFAGAPFLRKLPRSLGGYTFHCDLRDTVAREVCFTGRYEPQETQLAARVLSAGMTAVDVGANWGYFTLAAAHWVGPSGRVVAFEPEPRLFRMLSSNVSRNRLRHVTTRPLAVAARAGRVDLVAFEEAGGNWGTSQTVAAAGDGGCDAVGLDDQLDREKVGIVDLLKIDVEGAEGDVIEGMARGIASGRYRYVLLECHADRLEARAQSIEQCVAPFVAAGYTVRAIEHTPDTHRRAGVRELPASELLRPFDPAVLPEWPHLFFAAPGAADPA